MYVCKHFDMQLFDSFTNYPNEELTNMKELPPTYQSMWRFHVSRGSRPVFFCREAGWSRASYMIQLRMDNEGGIWCVTRYDMMRLLYTFYEKYMWEVHGYRSKICFLTQVKEDTFGGLLILSNYIICKMIVCLSSDDICQNFHLA